MSKSEILDELARLRADERREIFDRLYEMEELALLNGAEPSTEEKALLDRELEAYRLNPHAGSPWTEVSSNQPHK